MKRPLIAALALAVFASAADAQQFRLLNIGLGGYPGPPTFEQELTSTVGIIYQHEAGSNYAPTAEMVGLYPGLEYDSYIAVGGDPSTQAYSGFRPLGILSREFFGHFALGPHDPIDNRDWTRPLRHAWYVDVTSPIAVLASHSKPGPLGGQTVFVGRITVPSGARPVAPVVYLGVLTVPDNRLAGYYATLDGNSHYFDPTGANTRPLETQHHLVSYLADEVTLPGIGAADVYNIYVQAGFRLPGDNDPSMGPPDNQPGQPQPQDDVHEPNNTFAQAVPLPGGLPVLMLLDNDDFFSFNLNAPGRLTFGALMESQTTGVGLELYTSDGVMIGADYGSGRGRVISQTLTPGRYVVRMALLSGSARYQLQATFTPVNQADANDDGRVTVSDVLDVLRGWGESTFDDGPSADINEDGVINQSDLRIVLRALGHSRTAMTTRAWRAAMQRLYNREIRPLERPAPSRQQRRLDLERLIQAWP